jgi:hypothetical protein
MVSKNEFFFVKNWITMPLSKVWQVIFLLTIWSNVVVGQRKVNLNNEVFRNETVGSNFYRIAQYHGSKITRQSECYEAHLNIFTHFNEILPMCFKDIGEDEMNIVINGLDEIIKERNFAQECFLEDFSEQKKKLEELQKKYFPANKNNSTFNRERREKRGGDSKVGSNEWYGEPIYPVLCVLLLFIFWRSINNSPQKNYLKYKIIHLRENFRKSGKKYLLPIIDLIKKLIWRPDKREVEVLIKLDVDRKKVDWLAKLDADEKETERLANLKRDKKEDERLAIIERDKREVERLANMERDKKEAERVAIVERDKKEAERVAIVERDKKEAERVAIIERDKKEAERVAIIERDKKETERLAIIERDKKETERLAKLKPFFMPVPSGERLFFDGNRFPNYSAGRTTYKFTPKNDREATFEFCEEASSFAIDKPQTHIEPACEPLNARDNSAKGIKTRRNGIAFLEADGTWRVEEKAKIEYIY